MEMEREEIKKEIVRYYIGYFNSIKPLLESNADISEAYDSGQRTEILEVMDEVVQEIKEQFKI